MLGQGSLVAVRLRGDDRVADRDGDAARDAAPPRLAEREADRVGDARDALAEREADWLLARLVDRDGECNREALREGVLLDVGSADGVDRHTLRMTLFRRSATSSAPLDASAIKRGDLKRAAEPTPSVLPEAVLFEPASSVTAPDAIEMCRMTLFQSSET